MLPCSPLRRKNADGQLTGLVLGDRVGLLVVVPGAARAHVTPRVEEALRTRSQRLGHTLVPLGALHPPVTGVHSMGHEDDVLELAPDEGIRVMEQGTCIVTRLPLTSRTRAEHIRTGGEDGWMVN